MQNHVKPWMHRLGQVPTHVRCHICASKNKLCLRIGEFVGLRKGQDDIVHNLSISKGLDGKPWRDLAIR